VNQFSSNVDGPAAPATPDIGVPLIFQILNAARELQSRLETSLDELDLSPGKAGVLKTLARAGKPVPLSELAECNKCVRSNVTQLVDRLEADGLVRRTDDPDDRRVTLASLTDKGRKTYILAQRVVDQHEQEILGVLSPKEAAALTRVLRELTGRQE
jgi:DNA-binding MarR family transcriptional regulator